MQSSGWRRWALEIALGLVLPIGVAWTSPLVERLPSLGLLRGPAALVLVAVAALLALVRFLESRRPGWALALARAPAWLLLVVAGTLYAGVGLRHAAGLQVSGDEPHYLVMAQSLWRDHDLDLRDEYDGEEWAEFVPGPLRPHWGAPRADGRPFPAHSPGLPLLLAPAYAALGREGCVLVMALVAAAAALVCRRLALQLTGDEARLPGRPGSPRPGRRSSSTRSTSTRRRRRPSRRAGRWPCCSGRRAPREPRSPRFVPRRCRGCTSR